MKIVVQGTHGGENKDKIQGFVEVWSIKDCSNASVSVDSYVGSGDNYKKREIELIRVTNSTGKSVEVSGIDNLYDFLVKAKNTPNGGGIRHLSIKDGKRLKISEFPNFGATGCIGGMKQLYYGKDALLVKCGSYIYNVSSEPSIYYEHANKK